LTWNSDDSFGKAAGANQISIEVSKETIQAEFN